MEYRGQVKNGKIVLNRRIGLKDGAEVVVRPVPKSKVTSRGNIANKRGKSLLERLAPIVGKAEELPADFARNHDHYLHGQTKK